MSMKCVFCKVGVTHPQRVTVEKYNEAGELVALVQNFPAEVCDYCGEEYYQSADWARVEQLVAAGATPAKVTQIPVYALSA
jgi:YgiT-type zinc finger domain-containing protein